MLEKITGIKDLIPDPTFHTAGMHLAKKGGKIDVHLDYNIHPKLNLLRCVNLILFLSPDWKEEWGGKLELWDAKMEYCVKKIMPVFNQAIIFTTNDISYHGQPEPIMCPEGETRKTLTLWYHSEMKEPVSERYRGLFFKRPQDPDDAFVDKVREMRADPERAKEVYVIDENKNKL
jgi:Rps23 Pro-64 3,4-dihydroxylase Tpa1-like proline 4-hydroxylase